MGKPSSLAQSSFRESRDITHVRDVVQIILQLPNPALVFTVWCPIGK